MADYEPLTFLEAHAQLAAHLEQTKAHIWRGLHLQRLGEQASERAALYFRLRDEARQEALDDGMGH